jgi:hypothetical protein
MEVIMVQDSEVCNESNLRVRGVNKSIRSILYYYLLKNHEMWYMSEYLCLTSIGGVSMCESLEVSAYHRC